MEESSRTLEMSVPTIVGVVGFFIIGISLFLPSVEHGEVLNGLESMAISTLMAFLGFMKGGTATDMVFMSLVAVCVNCLAPLVLLLSTREREELRMGAIVAFGVLCIGVLCLAFVPYSGITRVYLGYYLWLLGLLVVGASGVIRSLGENSKGSGILEEI